MESKKVWKKIEKDFGISKRGFGRKIKFVSDKFKRKVIFRDVEHAFELANLKYSKASVVLAGGVIEELLRLYLEYKKIAVPKETYFEYVTICKQKGILKKGISQMSDVMRRFRNLVHLSGEKNEKDTISKAIAKNGVASIFTIVNDF